MRDLASLILPWFRRYQRPLPWRENRDPYSIWVSEIMLQQTTVATVTPYFQRFLTAFPTVEHLASADIEDVLRLWSGLGYYRRARLLHRAAGEIVTRFEGRFPRDLDGALSLPGVGRYTAGAVLSIAYDIAVPLVDGNVARVLARVFAIDTPLESSISQKRLWEIAQAVVPSTSPGDFNQGLMEIGSEVCRPTSPSCPSCPLRGVCDALELGKTELLPVRKEKTKMTPVSMATVIITQGDWILMRERGEDEIMAGLFEPPTLQNTSPDEPLSLAELRCAVESHWVNNLGALHSLGSTRHAIMNWTIRTEVLAATFAGKADPIGRVNSRWFSLTEALELPLTGMARKALVLFQREGWPADKNERKIES